MTDKQKLDKIMNLLLDGYFGKYRDNQKLFINEDEKFGAFVWQTHLFNAAYRIYKDHKGLISYVKPCSI